LVPDGVVHRLRERPLEERFVDRLARVTPQEQVC
jgi:hypothetical protein